MSKQAVVLVVDDNKVNQDLIVKFLAGGGYELEMAESGDEAWQKLQATPDKYSVVLLDRRMPGMDGMEVLRKIKQDARLKMLPVILQTAASFPEEIAEGVLAGAYYYLTKPYALGVMRAVVATAIRDRAELMIEVEDANNMHLALSLLNEAQFSFKTIDEVRRIATLLARLCASHEPAYMGLLELMLNAVEHGNLGITYQEKSKLIAEDALQLEIDRRLQLPQYADKFASVSFRREKENLHFAIKDEGQGFDWNPYLDMSMERIMDNHGRGIAMSRRVAFSRLEYQGKGNCVEACIAIPKGLQA
jgi:CheY-like chemotaxis protein